MRGEITPKKPSMSLFVGLNKSVVIKKELDPCPSAQKGKTRK